MTMNAKKQPAKDSAKTASAKSLPISPHTPLPSPSSFPKTTLKGKEGREEDAGTRTGMERGFFESWNAAAAANGWSVAKAMTSSRSAAFKARIKNDYFRDHWQEAIERMKESSFFKGVNARSWLGDIDFFLRPDSVVKIMEGKYDDRSHNYRKPRESTDHSKGFWQ